LPFTSFEWVPVRPDFFFLADAVSEREGKIAVEGVAITHLLSPEFPARPTTLTGLARLVIDEGDLTSDHQVVVRWIRPDGGSLISAHPITVAAEFLRNHEVHEEEQFSINLVIGMQGLSFPDPGLYRVQLDWDGEVVAEQPLLVRAGPAGTLGSSEPSSSE
jgi:hypothetical protein